MTRWMLGVAIAFDRVRTDRGSVLVEYSLLLALIAAVAMGAVASLGETLANEFERIASAIAVGG